MIKEVEFVKALIKNSPRSELQKNLPFMSDAEIVELDGCFYCLSVDTVAEEISLGIIKSKRSLAWLAVTASVSDLAAVGCVTQEVTVSISRAPHLTIDDLEEIRSGLEQVCSYYGCRLAQLEVFPAKQFVISCTAKGVLRSPPKLQRHSLGAGDQLYLTGPCGWGNAVAFANVALRSSSPDFVNKIDQEYRPLARVKESQFIAEWSRVCIDTSDGLIFSLDLLQELNQIGIQIDYSKDIFHPLALQISQIAKVNPWIFLAAQNGEFELLFSVPEAKNQSFLQAAKEQGHSFIPLGRVISGSNLQWTDFSGVIRNLDLAPLRNLLFEKAETQKYILALMQFASLNKMPESF